MRLFVLVVLALAATLAAVGCSGDDDGGNSVSATPVRGAEDGANDSVLGQVRLDAAKQLKLDALKVELKSLQGAGWDGCMGVNEPGKACRELFGAGVIAIFEGGGKELRYHLVGSKWVGPVDPAKASDGSPVPDELAIDFRDLLSRYARHDWSLRTKVNPTSLVIEEVLPATADPNAADAYVHMSVRDRDAVQWYRMGLTGIEQVSPPADLPAGAAEAASVEKAIREDMAKRGNGTIDDISILSYREVTWPDGCLGIVKPGQVCAQALVDGFMVRAGAGGKVYRYHGANGQFTNASLEPEATLTNPLPRR
ncbi:MAG: hypothetical protein LC118_13325 [Dehalococcoidia bacterium]|nr:hypothetical protein [Dehalococcoidia bacterium]